MHGIGMIDHGGGLGRVAAAAHPTNNGLCQARLTQTFEQLRPPHQHYHAHQHLPPHQQQQPCYVQQQQQSFFQEYPVPDRLPYAQSQPHLHYGQQQSVAAHATPNAYHHHEIWMHPQQQQHLNQRNQHHYGVSCHQNTYQANSHASNGQTGDLSVSEQQLWAVEAAPAASHRGAFVRDYDRGQAHGQAHAHAHQQLYLPDAAIAPQYRLSHSPNEQLGLRTASSASPAHHANQQQHKYDHLPHTPYSDGPSTPYPPTPYSLNPPTPSHFPRSSIPSDHYPPTPYSTDLQSPNSDHSDYGSRMGLANVFTPAECAYESDTGYVSPSHTSQASSSSSSPNASAKLTDADEMEQSIPLHELIGCGAGSLPEEDSPLQEPEPRGRGPGSVGARACGELRENNSINQDNAGVRVRRGHAAARQQRRHHKRICAGAQSQSQSQSADSALPLYRRLAAEEEALQPSSARRRRKRGRQEGEKCNKASSPLPSAAPELALSTTTAASSQDSSELLSPLCFGGGSADEHLGLDAALLSALGDVEEALGSAASAGYPLSQLASLRRHSDSDHSAKMVRLRFVAPRHSSKPEAVCPRAAPRSHDQDERESAMGGTQDPGENDDDDDERRRGEGEPASPVAKKNTASCLALPFKLGDLEEQLSGEIRELMACRLADLALATGRSPVEPEIRPVLRLQIDVRASVGREERSRSAERDVNVTMEPDAGTALLFFDRPPPAAAPIINRGEAASTSPERTTRSDGDTRTRMETTASFEAEKLKRPPRDRAASASRDNSPRPKECCQQPDASTEKSFVFRCGECDFARPMEASSVGAIAAHVATGFFGAGKNACAVFGELQQRVKLTVTRATNVVSIRTLLFCSACNAEIDPNDASSVHDHITSEEHRRKRGGATTVSKEAAFFCSLCDSRFPDLTKHVADASVRQVHAQRLSAMSTCGCQAAVAKLSASARDNSCQLCRVAFKPNLALPFWMTRTTCLSCSLTTAKTTLASVAAGADKKVILCHFCKQGKFGYGTINCNKPGRNRSSCAASDNNNVPSASICVNCLEILDAFSSLTSQAECGNYVRGMLNELIRQLSSKSSHPEQSCPEPSRGLAQNPLATNTATQKITRSKQVAVVSPEPRCSKRKRASTDAAAAVTAKKTSTSANSESLKTVLSSVFPADSYEVVAFRTNDAFFVDPLLESKAECSLLECLKCERRWAQNVGAFVEHARADDGMTEPATCHVQPQPVVVRSKSSSASSSPAKVSLLGVLKCAHCQLYLWPLTATAPSPSSSHLQLVREHARDCVAQITRRSSSACPVCASDHDDPGDVDCLRKVAAAVKLGCSSDPKEASPCRICGAETCDGRLSMCCYTSPTERWTKTVCVTCGATPFPPRNGAASMCDACRASRGAPKNTSGSDDNDKNARIIGTLVRTRTAASTNAAG